MARYVALLRAVNVGGTGKLALRDLKTICEANGCVSVETFIASGNVVFDHDADEAGVKAALECALAAHMGKRVGVLIRAAAELAAVLDANPFPEAESRFNYVVFLDDPPPGDALAHVVGQADEELRLGRREIHIHYGAGMGQSKLRVPAAKDGTARNMNTVARLVELAARANGGE